MKDSHEIYNIVLVSLDDKFCESVSIILSDKLDMYNACCKDLVEYDLINPKDVIDKCGIEYLKKREREVVKNCSTYINTVISINFDLFKDYFDLFNNSIIIYLSLPKEKITNSVSKVSFENRNEFLLKHCNKIVFVDKKLKNNTVNKILNILGDNL